MRSIEALWGRSCPVAARDAPAVAVLIGNVLMSKVIFKKCAYQYEILKAVIPGEKLKSISHPDNSILMGVFRG